MRVKQSLVTLLVFSLALLLPFVAGAQAQTPPPQTTAPEGEIWGDYSVQQSIEVGFRFSDEWLRGNLRNFNNFVNLHEGPRLLEQMLSMRSISHDAPLFDNLFISTFGFGGDPNNVARLKFSKNKWYNFSSSFRRDQNFFDYPILGNPLNPTTGYPVPANTFLGITATTVTTPQIQGSAHPFAVRRRMSDFNLTVLPQAVVTLRFGYSRNRSTGPSYSSIHEGTDFMLGGAGDNTNTTNNSYRFGVDFKFIPKTTISYDQTFDYYKNDTRYDLNSSFGNVLADLWAPAGYTSQRINFGLPFFGAPINNPCVGFMVTPAGLANPNCSGLYQVNPISGRPGYYKYQNTRTDTPSEQLSFVSRPSKYLDLTGRYIYSSADMRSPFEEDFYGAVTRTNERRWGQKGTATAKSINNSADISATIHFTEKLRLLETFRFYAWRTPLFLTADEWSSVPALMSSATSGGSARVPGQAGFTPFLLLPIVGDFAPSAALTQPQSAFGAHGSSTGADFGTVTTGAFLGQNAKSNMISLEYDFVRQFGVRLGYRYGIRRDAEKSGFEEGTEYYYPNPVGVGNGITAALRGNCSTTVPAGVTQTIAANGVCTAVIADELSEAEEFDVTEHTALFGLWFRPSHSFRFNGEVELSSFDAAVTRVAPRHQQHYRFRTTWNPSTKATLSATYNGIEGTNPGVMVPSLPATLVISGTTRNTVPSQQPNTLDINYRMHNRNFGITTSLFPNDKVGFNISYNYNNYMQSNVVCPVYTSLTPSSAGVAASAVPGLPICPLFPDQAQTGGGRTALVGSGATAPVVSPYNMQDGKFESTNQFISVFLTLRPVKRWTTQFGYSLSHNGGNMLVLSPWQGVGAPYLNAGGYYIGPNTYGAPGTLANDFHAPSITTAYDFHKNWTAKAAWNYWGFGEGAVAPGLGANGFRANLVTVSMRYAF